MNKKYLIVTIAVVWIFFIAGFLMYYQSIVDSGTQIQLSLRPVDPRDLFRGDYMNLNYEIGTVALNNFLEKNLTINDEIYLVLENRSGVFYAKDVLLQPPNEGVFIKGTVKSVSGSLARVEYGIESFFVPQGKGMEVQLNPSNTFALVAVDSTGKSVLLDLIQDGKSVKERLGMK